MRSYEDALRHWAAGRFDIPVDAIQSVTLEEVERSRGGCETCDYGADPAHIEIDLTPADYDQWTAGGWAWRQRLDYVSMQELMYEVFQAGAE